jgi:hypothetical protein
MPTAETAGQPPEVDQPKHQLHALTTYELRDYRRDLERAVAYFDKKDPVPSACRRLQARLDDVLAEQAERARLAHPDRRGAPGL